MHTSDDRPRIHHDWKCHQPTPEPTTIRDSSTGMILEVVRCWQCGAFAETNEQDGAA